MTILSEIIYPAFRKIGLKTADLTSDQVANALIAFNNMISSWGADFLTTSVISESFALTSGTAEYSIGSGGDFDTIRPMKVVSCFLRDSDGYDSPVNVMGSRDYSPIVDKDASGRPTALYFVPTLTMATITFDYAPDAAYTAYFEFWKNFTEYTTTSSPVAYPNEYKQPMILNLAINLDELWDRTVPNTLFIQAQNAYDLVKRLNASTRRVSKTKFDIPGQGRYNINTDNFS